MRKLWIAAVLVLAACGASPISPAIDATWTRSANFTTCAQWLNEMTPPQRTAMAAPLLPILRLTVDTAASTGTELLPAFVEAVGAACRGPHLGVTEDKWVVTAAATTAFIGDKRFQP